MESKICSVLSHWENANLAIEVEISDFFGDSVMSRDFFSGHYLMRECFAEDRHVIFLWKLSYERAHDVLLEGMLVCDV